MIHILGEVTVADIPKFLEAFSTKGLEARRKHHSIESKVFKVNSEENRVYILFKWESMEAFKVFQGDMQVKEGMKAGGVIGQPTFTMLEPLGEFQG